jgi:hypothetical protein
MSGSLNSIGAGASTGLPHPELVEGRAAPMQVFADYFFFQIPSGIPCSRSFRIGIIEAKPGFSVFLPCFFQKFPQEFPGAGNSARLWDEIAGVRESFRKRTASAQPLRAARRSTPAGSVSVFKELGLGYTELVCMSTGQPLGRTGIDRAIANSGLV